MRGTATNPLLAPTVGTGVLMAVYLVLRPYGDATEAGMAAAFASTAWVIAHVCGALALASVGRLGLRLADVSDSLPARLARWTGLAGAVLVLPYYGAETFGLHAVGRLALTDPAALVLVDAIRNQPVAITMFGIGLLLISAAGVCLGLAATRSLQLPGRLAWPLAIAVALFPAQFFTPPAIRIAFGIAYALAAALFAIGTRRHPLEVAREQARTA